MAISSHKLRIRPSTADNIDSLMTLCQETLTANGQDGAADDARLRSLDRGAMRTSIAEGCVLSCWHEGRIIGMSAIDLDEQAVSALCVHPTMRRRGFGRRLLAAAERRAAAFQLLHLKVWAVGSSTAFFTACGYDPVDEGASRPGSHDESREQPLYRAFPRRQSRFGRDVKTVSAELGIPQDYARVHRLPLQIPPSRLVPIGKDIHQRDRQLRPGAANAWERLRLAARRDGIELQLVSAFRSVDYQADIIRRKVSRGLQMDEILRVSAAPGFSEHHTGRAVDLTTPGSRPLEEEFEDTPAYLWLCANASKHGFRQSFPRDNIHGIAFEPWHWCHVTG